MTNTTLSHLERIAAHAPARTAAVANGRVVGYAALVEDVAGRADRLRKLALPPGRTVAVGCAQVYPQLLAAVALEAMGVAVASFRPDEGAGCEALLRGADAAVCDADIPSDLRPLLAARFQEDRSGGLSLWTRRASRPDGPAPGPDAPMAVIRSSGSTGRPKRMLLTRAMFDARCRNRVEAYGLTSASCCFAAMHLSVHTVHVGIAATWRLGGCAMTEDRMPLADALAIYRPTHLSLLPRQTEALLAELPAGFSRIDRLTLVSLGARLTAALRDAVLARLAGAVVDHYGSNEAGLICALGPDGTGALAPGLSARIVDEAGREALEGRLQVAGPAVASGYLDGSDARCFTGGWFEPGDTAALPGGGRLRLIGRDDDVLNLGGVKLACADIEAALAELPGVQDAAVAAVSGTLAIGVAVTNGADADAVLAAVRAQEPGARVTQVAQVPRTPLGKIRRRELRALLESG